MWEDSADTTRIPGKPESLGRKSSMMAFTIFFALRARVQVHDDLSVVWTTQRGGGGSADVDISAVTHLCASEPRRWLFDTPTIWK